MIKIKRTIYKLIFVSFMMFCIMQSVFAGFKVTVINKTGIEYKAMELVITAVGFDAMYGRISLGKIGTQTTPQVFSFGYEYLKVPLTGLSMPESLEECNLNLFVVANPNIAKPVISYKFFNIIAVDAYKDKLPQIISEEGSQSAEPPREGIKPPDITITIERNSNDGIKAAFSEN
jgi:hypothetical protein